MAPLRIYLCDLTHDTIVLVSDTIPINIGFIGSYARSVFGDDIDVRLFKYPQSAMEAIAADPPDVLALSNYSWNSNLSEHVARFAKARRPATITVQGGTNFPHDPGSQLSFLLSRPSTDVHVELEGELAFSNLIRRVLEARDSGGNLLSTPVDGCVFVEPSTRASGSPVLVTGARPERLRDLSVIPSPYLDGTLDHFFDGRLTPFIETNRGCPFSCSFCHTGNSYFQKTNLHPIDRLRDELEYIGSRAAALGIVNLHIADTNFGMYPRDREVAEALYEIQKRYDWPLHVISTTGKNNKERVIEITDILGDTFPVNMAVQSMDEKVLKTIRRSNIKLEDYTRVNDHLRARGRASVAEIILGLPGETRDSFLSGVAQVIEAGVSKVTIYTLMLLNGTEFKEPAYRARHGIIGKYRIVPLNFSTIDDRLVFDYEEVGVQTKDMTFDDYLYLRGFSVIVETLHNDRPFEEFFRYALSLGVRRPEMLQRIYDSVGAAPQAVRDVLSEFLRETETELWDSEEELVSYYSRPDNFERLVAGEAGGNLIYKYKSISLTSATDGWINHLAHVCLEMAAETLDTRDEIDAANAEIAALASFCGNRLEGLLIASGDAIPMEMDCDYDIAGWLRSPGDVRLSDFLVDTPVHYEFFYTEAQIKQQVDARARYGTDINALSKIVTRVSSVQSLIRKVRTSEGEQRLYDDVERDGLTRYSLAN